MKSIGVLLGILMGASGCVTSVEATRLNQAPHPLVARPAHSVEIYSSAPPTRPHVDIALLRADQSNYATDMPAMVQALAKRAGELGCDALFISGTGERPGAPGNGYVFDPGSRILLGTCIAYLEAAPATTSASASEAAPVRNAIQLIPAAESQPAAAATRINVLNNGDARR